MSVWRGFYATHLDFWSWRSALGTPLDRRRDTRHFMESVQAALLLAAASCVVLQVG